MKERHKTKNSVPIAIVGISCRFPGASDYRQFWSNLDEGKNFIKVIPKNRWDVDQYYSAEVSAPNKSVSRWCGLVDDIDKFDNRFFGISPREAQNIDPQQRMLLEETWRCIEDSGVPLGELRDKRTAVSVGVMANDYQQLAVQPGVAVDNFACLGSYDALLANRISYVYGLTGPSVAFAAACASSHVACHAAVSSLRSGDCDFALVAAASLNIHPWKYVSFSKSRMLSPRGQCKTFDIDADGYVPGDGVGVLLLRRYEDALLDRNHIYGVIRGSAVNHASGALSFTAPSIQSQQEVIAAAYRDAGIDPASVSYIEAHGTGTSLGDPIEVEALTRAFREYTAAKQFCKIGSVKSNIGHLEAAAGIAGIIKVLLMFKNRRTPKTLNISRLNPIIRFPETPFVVALEGTEWSTSNNKCPLRAGVSSFGMGGVNSHIVLEYPDQRDSRSDRATGREMKDHFFILSAKSEGSLRNLMRSWTSFVRTTDFERYSLSDICGTLLYGRQSHTYRCGAMVKSKKDISACIGNEYPDILKSNDKPWVLRLSAVRKQDLPKLGEIARDGEKLQGYEDIVRALKKLKITTNGRSNSFGSQFTSRHHQASQFVFHFWYLKTLIDAGLAPDMLVPDKDGLLAALGISGMAELKDILAYLTGKKSASAIRLKRPKIPVFDGGTGKIIKPFSVSSTYIKHLMERLSIEKRAAAEFIDKAELLKKKQFTLRNIINEWNPVLKRYGTDTDALAGDPARFSDARYEVQRRDLLLLVILITSFRKLEQKWNLDRSEYRASSEFHELADLVTDNVLPPQAAAQLLLAGEADLSAAASAVHDNQHLLDQNKRYVHLRKTCRSFSEHVDIDQWLAVFDNKANAIDYRQYNCVDFGNMQNVTTAERTVSLYDTSNDIKTLRQFSLELFLNGAQIELQRIAGNKEHRKIPLPACQFDKYAFWLPQMNAEGPGAHPAVELRSTRPIGMIHSRYRATREYAQNDPKIAGHVIAGQTIIPASEMISYAVDHQRDISAVGCSGIKSMSIVSPEILQGRSTLNIKAESGGNHFEITSAGGELRCYGEYAVDDSANAGTALDASRFSSVLTFDLYKELAGSGYNYGPAYRIIRSVKKNKTHYLFEIRKDRLDAEQSTAIDTIVLDGIFQAAIVAATLAGKSYKRDHLYVPYHCDTLLLSGRLGDEALVVIDTEKIEKNAKDLTVPIVAYDMTGRRLLSIQQMVFKEISSNVLRIGGGEARDTTSSRSGPHRHYYYRPKWVRQEPTPAGLSRKEAPDVTVVFSNNGILAERLLQSDQVKATKIYRVVKSDRFRHDDSCGTFEIDPLKEQDYVEVLQEIAGYGRDRRNRELTIYYLWSALPEDTAAGNAPRHSTKYIYENIQPFFYLLKAVTVANIQKPIMIIAATGDSFEITSGDRSRGFAGAMLAGCAKTAMLENSLLDIKIADLGKDHREQAEHAGLLLKLSSEEAPCLTGFRDQKAYTRRFFQYNVTDLSRSLLKAGGVYVIAGGAGGIGREIVSYLAEKLSCRIVTIGRSTNPAGILDLQQRAKQAAGGIDYISCDITNAAQLAAVFDRIRSSYGKINGVIQASGAIDDGLLMSKKWESIKQVLSSKIDGTLNLNELTKNDDLDFFMVFSSVVSISGNIGQIDYAAANSFLDSFIHYRKKGHFPGKSICLNWTLWEATGMGSSSETIRNFKKRGVGAISPDGRTELLNDIFSIDESLQLLVTAKELAAENDSNIEVADVTAADDARTPESQDGCCSADPANTRNYLLNIFASKLTTAPHEIDPQESFFSMGMESVVLLELMEELNKEFDDLPPTLLFQYPNIEKLTGYLAQKTPVRKRSGEASVNAALAVPLTITGPSEIAKNPERRRFENMDNKIAIVGMSGRYPKAPDVNAFWANLVNGVDCIEVIPKERWDNDRFFSEKSKRSNSIYSNWGGFIKDADKFDPLFFNIAPMEAEQMDPAQRLFLECTWHAMEDAGYGNPRTIRDKTVGLFVGVMWNDFSHIVNQEGYQKNRYLGPGSLYWGIANRVSYFMDFKGPSIALDTACSSSLVALHLACQSILQGDCDMAIAGGVNLTLHPSKYIYLSETGFLSTDGKCRSFGEGGDGYVPGEGVGAVLLKPLKDALQDRDHVYGCISGSAINHGGKATGFTVPNPDAQAKLIKKAIDRSGVKPEQISYIECHGTGTSLGDPVEIQGLEQALTTGKRQFFPIGSVKSNVGHLEAAAGIVALTKVLKSMEHGMLPKNLHSDVENSKIDFKNSQFYIVKNLQEWKTAPGTPKVACISSFGAGGANAHVVVEELQVREAAASGDQDKANVFVLSAKNRNRLRDYVGAFIDYFGGTDGNPGAAQTQKKKAASIRHGILEIIASLTSVNKHDLDNAESLGDMGFDPLLYNALAGRINKAYSLTITAKDISDCEDLAALVGLVTGKTTGSSTLPAPSTSNDLARIAYTLQCGRRPMEERLAIIASDISQLKQKLIEYNNGAIEISGVFSGNVKKDAARHGADSSNVGSGESIAQMAEKRELESLARLWISGSEIPWNLMYQDGPPVKIPLPAYPFEKQSFMIAADHSSAIQGERAVEIHADLSASYSKGQNLLLTKQWGPAKIESTQRTKTAAGNYILLLRNGYSEDLAAGLFTLPHMEWTIVADSYTAKQASGGSYAIPYSDYRSGCEVIERILADKKTIAGVVDLSDILSDGSSRPAIDAAKIGIYQTLIRNTKSELELVHITRGLQAFENDRPTLSGALTWGLARLLGHEYGKVRSCTIDLDYNTCEPAKIAKILSDRLGSEERVAEICFRNNTPYLPFVSRCERDWSNNQKTSFDPDKAYVIAGGTGGIGLAIAKYLIANNARKIALIGYNKLPDKTAWNEERIRSFDEKTQKKIRAISELEKTGAVVEVYFSALTEKTQLKSIFSKVTETLGKIGGIVNSAMAPFNDTPYFINKNIEEFLSIVEPKMQGTINLTELSEEFNADFMIHFSSVASAIPSRGAGNSHYAVGNAFIDLYSDYKRAQGNSAIRSVNWVYWGQTGGAATDNDMKRLDKYGIYPITNDEGYEHFGDILRSRQHRFIAGRLSPELLGEIGYRGDRRQEPHAPSKKDGANIDAMVDRYHRTNCIKLGTYSSTFAALQEYACLTVVKVFREKNLLLDEGEIHTLDELRNAFQLSNKYERLFTAMLSILERNRLIRTVAEKITTTNMIKSREIGRFQENRGKYRDELGKKHPEARPYINFLDRISAHYPELLSGRRNATEVIFPKGSMEHVEKIYTDTDVSKYFNELLAFYIQTYCEEKRGSFSRKKKLEILEIGSGTGGSSAVVLDGIRKNSDIVSYTYTDISHGFLNYGKSKFDATYDFITYKLLNIEHDVQLQNIETGKYDIIFATNVLHATRLIQNTLQQAKKLLKKDGVILINEITHMYDIATLIFGLLDGWWLYDENRIENSPLLGMDQWQEKLERAGFLNVRGYGLESPTVGAYYQSVIIGQSDGVIDRAADVIRTAEPESQKRAGLPSAPAARGSSGSTVRSSNGASGVQVMLRDIFARVLKMAPESIEDDESFGSYGVDSIVMGSLIREIETQLDISLNPSIIIENDTLERLAAAMGKEYPDAVAAKKIDVAAPPPSVEDGPIADAVDWPAEGKARGGDGQQDKVAVVGIAGILPGAKDVSEYWQILAAGKDCVSEIPRSRFDYRQYYQEDFEQGKITSKWGGFIEDMEYFDSKYFNIKEEDALHLDPLVRKFLEVSAQCIGNAGYDAKALWNKRVGVFVGARASNYSDKLPEYVKSSITGIGQNFIAAHVSHYFNFTGPNLVIDSACSSSLVSLHLACQSILLGESECALAGGVDLLLDEKYYLILSAMRALSPDGKCHTFDAKANGFVVGEGAGAVLLKPLSRAIRDGNKIYGVIDATAVNNDGNTMGISTPNLQAQREVVEAAQRRGGVDPASVGMIEAHGTGTLIGDPIELKALTTTFRTATQDKQFCAIGSVKTNIGHLLSAAGIASFLKVILALENRKIPPTLNCSKPNPRFEFSESPFFVNDRLLDWDRRSNVRRAGISSFGLGGTNAHIIVSEFDGQSTPGYRQTLHPREPILFKKKRYWPEPAGREAPRRADLAVAERVGCAADEVRALDELDEFFQLEKI